MSQVNTITIPAEEGTQLPISDSLTSPDSGVTASSKAAYDLNNKISNLEIGITSEIKQDIDTLNTKHTADINSIKASISNVNNTADVSKNVASAAKLTSVRTIGGVDFDGTKNIDLPGVNITGNQGTTGNAATATKLATARTIGNVLFDGSANISLPGVNAAGNQSTSGNAATATKLATARTITLSGGVTGSATFDGSSNVTLVTENPYKGTINAVGATTHTSTGTGNTSTVTQSLMISGNAVRLNNLSTLKNCNCQCSDSGA